MKFFVKSDLGISFVVAQLKPVTKFCGNSIEVSATGIIRGQLLKHREVYEMTYPKFVVKGVILGNMRLELSGASSVRCDNNGYSAELEFKPKARVCGKVFKDGQPLYDVEGAWNKKVFMKNVKTGEEKMIMDISKMPRVIRSLPRDHEQFPTETNK